MGCCSNNGGDSGPFAKDRELVEFVYRANGGALRDRLIPGRGLETVCQDCSVEFTLTTFVGKCPACGGVHAVSPPRADDAVNIQFAGKTSGYQKQNDSGPSLTKPKVCYTFAGHILNQNLTKVVMD